MAQSSTKTKTKSGRVLNVHKSHKKLAYHAQRAHRAARLNPTATSSNQLLAYRENDNQHNQAMIAFSAAIRAAEQRAMDSNSTREAFTSQLNRIGDQFVREMVRWNKTREAIADDMAYAVTDVPVQTFVDPNSGEIKSDIPDTDAGITPLDNDLMALLGLIGNESEPDLSDDDYGDDDDR